MTNHKVFETPGALYQKVKEVQQVSGGVTNTTYRASYDEAGRLIRTINDGYIWTYAVDKTGNSYLQDLSMTKEGNNNKYTVDEFANNEFLH